MENVCVLLNYIYVLCSVIRFISFVFVMNEFSVLVCITLTNVHSKRLRTSEPSDRQAVPRALPKSHRAASVILLMYAM